MREMNTKMKERHVGMELMICRRGAAEDEDEDEDDCLCCTKRV